MDFTLFKLYLSSCFHLLSLLFITTHLLYYNIRLECWVKKVKCVGVHMSLSVFSPVTQIRTLKLLGLVIALFVMSSQESCSSFLVMRSIYCQRSPLRSPLLIQFWKQLLWGFYCLLIKMYCIADLLIHDKQMNEYTLYIFLYIPLIQEYVKVLWLFQQHLMIKVSDMML